MSSVSSASGQPGYSSSIQRFAMILPSRPQVISHFACVDARPRRRVQDDEAITISHECCCLYISMNGHTGGFRSRSSGFNLVFQDVGGRLFHDRSREKPVRISAADALLPAPGKRHVPLVSPHLIICHQGGLRVTFRQVFAAAPFIRRKVALWPTSRGFVRGLRLVLLLRGTAATLLPGTPQAARLASSWATAACNRSSTIAFGLMIASICRSWPAASAGVGSRHIDVRTATRLAIALRRSMATTLNRLGAIS